MTFEVHIPSEAVAEVDNLPMMTVMQMKKTNLPDEVDQVVEEGRLMGNLQPTPKRRKC
jgi:hypothetical protein